jgi:hypothetical protein
MPTHLSVNSRILGASSTAPQLEPTLLNLLEQRLTVAELIRLTVEEQVRTLVVRQRLAVEEAQELLDRHYADQRTDPPRAPHQPHTISAKRETARAQRAFAEGRYVIIVNGRQVEQLDEEVVFDLDAKVTFLRLTPLVGG